MNPDPRDRVRWFWWWVAALVFALAFTAAYVS